jgi:hypothetical protein
MCWTCSLCLLTFLQLTSLLSFKMSFPISSPPEFFHTTIIPAPSEAALAAFQPLALISTEHGVLSYHWWSEQRKVVIWAEMYDLWLLQKDLMVRASIADILDWPESFVHAENLMLFDDPQYNHGFQLPEALARMFGDCEWSDYACDHRPVSAHVTKKSPALPAVASASTAPVVFPPFRASRWSQQSSVSEESSSDDELPRQPLRRRWH